MKKIGIICAMQREEEQLASRLQVVKTVAAGPFMFGKGILNGCEIILAQSGMGKVNAALCALELIKNFTPDCVINTGVAGGLQPTLNVLDSVIGTQYVYHDVWCGDGNEKGQVQGLPARFVSDRRLAEAALMGGCSNVKHGLTCTGDQFITDKEALSRIKADFPDGLAVDMESAAIAQVCFLMHVPFLSIRIVSDTPGATPDHFSQYLDFWKELSERSFKNLHSMLEHLPVGL